MPRIQMVDSDFEDDWLTLEDEDDRPRRSRPLADDDDDAPLPSSSNSSSRRSRINRLLTNGKDDLVRMARRAGVPAPTRWNKGQLAEAIVDAQDNIPTLHRTRRSRAAPYTQSTSHGITKIRDRESDYTRRIRDTPDSRGGLSASYTFQNPYGSHTLTSRIKGTKVAQFRRDMEEGKAGFTGVMMSKERAAGFGQLADVLRSLGQSTGQRSLEF